MNIKKIIMMGLVATASCAMALDHVEVTDVKARQRYPWNGLVDVTVTFQGMAEDVTCCCVFLATNSATKAAVPVEYIMRNGDDVVLDGVVTRRFIWNARADVGELKIDDVALTVEVKPLGSVQLWEGGPYFAECNVGATKLEECGYYFWWGDTVGYKRNSNNNGWISAVDLSVADGLIFSGVVPSRGKDESQLQSEGYIDASGNLAATHDAATVHWGAPWRLPTDAEFSALVNNCDSEWMVSNGVKGCLIKGRGLYSTKKIFLPAAGYGEFERRYNLGSDSGYWSSTPYPNDSYDACNLVVTSSGISRTRFLRSRGNGLPIRPVRETAGDERIVSGFAVTNLKLDCRTGDRLSAGTEELTFSNLWDGDAEATVTIAQDGAAIFTGLTSEGVKTWTVDRNGRYVLTHTTYTNGVAGKVETAVFVVEGKEVPVGELTVAWEEGSFMYDNNGKTPGVTAKNGDQLLEKGVDYTVRYEGNTNAGTAKAILTGLPPYVGSVTNEFAIAKRSVELTSGSASKPYDGTALVCHSVTTNGDGFVSGEGVDFAFTGSQTIAGSSKNAFDYALKTGTLAGNYTITKTEGDLEVTSGEIVNPFDPDDPSKPVTPEVLAKANCITNYDGDGHSIKVAAILNPLIAANNPKITYSFLRDGTYEVKNPTFTNVVLTSVWYRIEADNFSLFSTNALLKILPRSIANVDVAAIGDQTYTGSGIEPIPAVTDMRTLIGMSEPTDILTSADYDLSYLNNTNVGTAKIVLTGKNNYEGVQTNTFQIVPAIIPPGPDGAIVTTGYTNAYDGAAHGVSVSATGLKTQPTVQYKGSLSAEWQSDSPTYTDVCDTQVWWKVSAPNYQSVEGTIGLKITQAANAWTTEPAIEGWTYGETAKTPVGAAKFGTVSFAYSPMPVGAAGDYTMTATVAGTANYTGLSNSVDFTIAKGSLPPGDDPDPTDPSVDPDDPGQREDPTIPFSAFDYVGMYDGEAHTIDTNALKVAYATALGEGVACMYARAQNGVWTADPLTFKDAVVTSFWYKVTSANYADIVKPCKVAITNRPVTVTSGTKLDFTYDGKPHAFTNLTVTAGSFVAGEGIATSNWATVTMVAEGQVPNAFDYVALDGTKLSNYDLMVVTGKIAVVKGTLPPSDDPDPTDPSIDPDDPGQREDPTIPFSAFDYVGMYDGAAHTIDTNALKAAYATALGEGVACMYARAQNGVWTAEPLTFKDAVVTSFWYKVTSANYADIVKPCKVAITNRPVTVTSGTKLDFVYDGNSHAFTNLTVTAGSFVAGEGIATSNWATVTTVAEGEVPNSFDYVAQDGTKLSNYDLTVVTGKIAVVSPDAVVVTITGHVASVTYDGTKKSVSGYDVVSISDSLYTAADFKFVGQSVTNGTNAGTYPMGLKSSDFVNTNANFSSVVFNVTDGRLVITQAANAWTTEPAIEGWTYGETAKTPVGAAKFGEVSFSYSPMPVGAVGDYVMTATVAGTANYTGLSKSVGFKISKGALPPGDDPDPLPPGVNPDDPGQREDPDVRFSAFDYVGMYDGEAHTIDTNALKQAWTAALGAVTLGYSTASNGAYQSDAFLFKDAVVTSFWYKVTSANYADIVKPCKVAITNRPVTVTSGTKLDFVYDGKPHAFTNLMVTAGSFVAGEGIATSNWATVTAVAEGEVPNAFDYVALDGTKLENYDLTIVTGKIAVVSPDAVVVTITGHVASVTYDGTKKSVSGYDVVSISDPLYTAADFKFVGQSSTNGTNAGTYPMGLKVSDFVNTNANFSSVVFNVTDGKLVIAQAENAWTTEPAIEGWTYGETAKTPVGAAKFGEVSFAYSPMPVGAAGDYTMTATVAVTANYTGLSKSVGFTIAKATLPGDDPDPTDPGVDPDDPGQREDPTIPFSAFDYVGMYDGAAHTIDTNALKAAYVAALGEGVACMYARAQNRVWTAEPLTFKDAVVTSFWYKVTSANYADIVKPCKVAITNRPVTVTSGTKLDFTYDGKSHAYTNLTVTAGSFVVGEGIATSNWATVTAVVEGQVPNSFDYVALDGTKLSNYDLTVVTGKIAVVKGPLSPDDDPDPTDPSVDPDDPGQREDPTIPFSAFDYVGMYDGAAHTIDTNALKVAYATALGEGVACMYARAQNGVWTAEPLTFKDAVVTSFWYKVTSANYADIVKPCKVAITNRPVTVTSGTKLDFTYDGKPHAFTNLTVTAGSFVAGEGIATSNWATVTTVAEGEVSNTFDYVALDGTKLSNYDLTVVTGKIAVVMPPVSTVKVVLDAIGGKVQGKNVVTQDVVGIYGTLPDASRENYIFDGWFLGVSNDSPQAVSGGAVLAEGNHTLFARWSYDPSVTPDPTTIYKWEAIDANTARITGFLNANQQLQKMVLPDRIGDRFVTEIGASAFANTKCGVKELVLPMFCVVIDSKAFLGIETLETVTFATARLWNDPFTPASVAIGTYAFSGAKALASIMLCKEIASLGNYAFLNTRNLSSITILGKPTVGTQVFRSSGMDAGGVTIHLDPALASDTAYMAALKANMSNVTVKTDAIVTSLTMSTLGMRGTSVRLTVSVEKAAEWGQVDLGAIRVKYRNTLSDPATVLTPTAATRNADGTVTLEVAPPEGTSGFFQTIIKR